MKGWLYVIHFDTALCHAKHYTGCTVDIKNRLIQHANGKGSHITRELHARGIEWRLTALFRTTTKEMRTIERYMKNRHNGPEFCPACDGTSVPGGTPFDLSLLPFEATSAALRTKERPEIQCRIAQQEDQEGIRIVMKEHNEVLGFIPIGGRGGFTLAIEKKRVIVAEQGKRIVGYIIWTETDTSMTIQQVAVASGWQQQGIGTLLLETAEFITIDKIKMCNVRDDLPANAFWLKNGYEYYGHQTHKTSGSNLNHYEKGDNK